MGVINFRNEEYPDNILKDMREYVELTDRQLISDKPHFIKEFIDFENGNRINRKKFELSFGGFNTYHRSNKKKSEIGANNEIKGVYVLAELVGDSPTILNVGISQTILRRFYQHTCGKKHNQSTFGFYMALHKYKEQGKIHIGKRETFPYDDYRDDCLNTIRNLRFAIVPIENNFELYMAEIYLACHYKAHWNTFETH